MQARPRRHVVISGTGRSGTTFLVELLTHLGFDTGFSPGDIQSHKHPIARAGLEHDIRREDTPYIVKSPGFCDYAADIFGREDIVVEHLLVPIRDLEAAAESRRNVVASTVARMPLRRRLRHFFRPEEIPGGLWHTRSSAPCVQEDILLQQVYKLVMALSEADIPLTVIRYPRLTTDAAYLFERLRPILDKLPFETFERTFRRIAQPGLVHRFGPGDC